jgi:CRP-like cAMP-binding protein
MDKENLVAFFQSSKVIGAAKAVEIADLFEPREMGKNDFFVKHGKVSNEYLFLEAGFMRAFAIDTNGNEVTTNFYGSKQVVFEVSSFFNRTVSRENIQCVTDCRGWFITFDQVNNLFHTIPEFREFGRSILVRGITTLKNRMLSMITDTAEQRYEKLMNTNPEVFQSAPLKHIASYLGITDTSLSRIRKEFAKK